jgi:hypothetical protein
MGKQATSVNSPRLRSVKLAIKFKMQVLVALAFHLDKFQHGFEVDHIDQDPQNNRADNLRPLSRSEHVQKTRDANPSANKSAITCSRILKLTSSTTHNHLVGQEKKTGEWSQILGIPTTTITPAVHRKTSVRGHRFVHVVGVLLPGEEEHEHSIYHAKHANTLVSYKVSTFGRYWNDKAWTKEQLHVRLAGKKWGVWQLVLLAKTKDRSIPDGMTVDHIDGRDGEWPHRMDNLRWCTATEQLCNRDCAEDS